MRSPCLLKREQGARLAVDHLEQNTAAAGHTGQWIIGHDDRQTGFLSEQFIEVTQQRAATSENQTALGDIRSQLRWRLLERALDRLGNGRQ